MNDFCRTMNGRILVSLFYQDILQLTVNIFLPHHVDNNLLNGTFIWNNTDWQVFTISWL